MSDIDEAKELVNDFSERSSPQAFSNAHRDQVASGLLLRIENPSLITQPSTWGVCVPAEMVHNLALHNKREYVRLVTGLFEHGRARFGTWSLNPSFLVKNSQVNSATDGEEVDWIPMISIRDCKNFFPWYLEHLAYSGTDDGINGKESVNLLKKAGYKYVWSMPYRAPGRIDHDAIREGEMNLRNAADRFRAGYDVALRLDAGILYHPIKPAKGHPNHRVSLAIRHVGNESISFMQADDKQTVRLSVYTWGRIQHIPLNHKDGAGHIHHGHLHLRFFLEYYYGYIACRDLAQDNTSPKHTH